MRLGGREDGTVRLLLTGGTGFIGRALSARCEQVHILTRDPDRGRTRVPHAQFFGWNPYRDLPPPQAFEGVDVVVNLAGDSIGDGRWTAEKKSRLRSSRLATTRHLVNAMESLPVRPRAFVSASALGYYGDRGDELLSEAAGPGTGFLADLAREWEAEALRAAKFGVRTVVLRTSLVLGRGGEAVDRLFRVFRWGLGGRLGSGRQWMSWIHLDDLTRLYLFAAENEKLAGAVNASAPAPVRNSEFTALLAAALRRPALLPAPAFALRLVLGEFADSLLASQRMQPAAALAAGFSFHYPTLDSALAEIVGDHPAAA